MSLPMTLIDRRGVAQIHLFWYYMTLMSKSHP
ncbi:hypothetical protein NVIRPANT_00150 [Pantoea sp. Nvir]|nr:hypothetical protein NVIRPANT_00150 [Pantoea sp. Nvir]